MIPIPDLGGAKEIRWAIHYGRLALFSWENTGHRIQCLAKVWLRDIMTWNRAISTGAVKKGKGATHQGRPL